MPRRIKSGQQRSAADRENFIFFLCPLDGVRFREAGLLSPVYDFTDRGGCWFCPNARRRELRHLYDHHPDLWARMLELQALPGKVTEKFNRTTTFSEIDAGFRREDEQLSLWKNAA